MVKSKKKIIVFGGSGFLGSHVSDALTKDGHKVIIIDYKKSKWINKDQSFHKGDINNPKTFEHLLKKVDAIFNFAAISDIGKSNEDPEETVKINILGVVNLLNLCVKRKIKKFIQASSIYVSGNHGGFYKSSKLAAESYISEFNKIKGLNYCILRYGTLYGPRSDKTNGLHSLIENALKKNKIEYSGSPESVRDYIHVIDAARASLKALDKEFINKTIIISGPESHKITEILKIISEITGIKKISFVKKDKVKLHSHYLKTPYSSEENSYYAFKYSDNLNVDIGQGLSALIKNLKEY